MKGVFTVKCQPYRQSILEKFKLNLKIVRSKGAYHYDDQGRKILDGVSQYGALPLGHNSDEIATVITDYLQAEAPNFIQPFVPQSTAMLAERLIEIAGRSYDNVVFANTGTESVEAAFKLARLKTGRRHILSLTNSFHGKTFSSLSATGSDRYADPKIIDLEHFDKVPMNDVKALKNALELQKYAAFIMEPVQGEGGMIPADAAFVREAAALCKQYGTLFILDEIQTGMGRTGEMLAMHRYAVEADVVLLSKALGGGMIPIGALIIKHGVYNREFDKKHSSTFANGGLACAVGLGVVDALLAQERLLLEHVKECETLLLYQFELLAKKYSNSFAYSGVGMMYALHFSDITTEGNYIINYAQKSDLLSLLICGYLVNEKGIFCMPLLNDTQGGSIRFQPALNISKVELMRFLGAFEDVCKIINDKRYDILMGYLVDYKPAVQEGHIAPARNRERVRLSPKPVSGEHYRFAFLLHSTSPEDICKGFPLAIKTHFSSCQQRELAAWFFSFGEIENTPEVVFEFSMASPQGNTVNGAIIYSPVSPQAMLKLNRADKQTLMNNYLTHAEKFGASLVGLGAYTSVISKGGIDVASEQFNFTTGNSFTAVASCNAVLELLGDNIGGKHLMIFGARGSVGRLALMTLSQKFGRVDIVGSLNSTAEDHLLNLRNVLVEILHGESQLSEASAAGKLLAWTKTLEVDRALKTACHAEAIELIRSAIAYGKQRGEESFNIFIGLDNTPISPALDCVFSATSEGKSFISADIFPPSCHVFDVARPFDVLNEESSRQVYEGGLVHLPDRRAMLSDCNIIGCHPGVSLACLSETIMLSMDQVDSSYSLGKEIAYSQMKKVAGIAEKHGFSHFIEYGNLPKTY
ncbi:aminotransferase class III-fold pyridoxal phosphate-dependent enzyme [Serratia sp. RJAL6]|nr:aminotransferase class III-fold pyridoxal phosphate-dependent enzyme [Enterobacter sp. RJAL6]